MKTGFKLLFLLTILFCSCYENEVLVSQVEAGEQEVEQLLTPDQQANEGSIVMTNILADMMKAISVSSELNFNSEERRAEVRNSCPSTFLISDGNYPDTFFIDFDNCDPSAVFDQRYNGGVMFILYGELEDPNTCPLFSIKNSPNSPEFRLTPDDNGGRSYLVDITNDVDFCLASSVNGNLKYNYTLDEEIVLDFSNDNTTTYPDGMEGCVTLKSNNKDDTTKPSTLIDNTYCVSAKPTIIECKNRAGVIERICISTNPEGISYNLRCGCPQTGKLYINSPANGACENIQSTSAFWDYGFIQNPGSSSCENSALDPDNIVQRIPCGQSF